MRVSSISVRNFMGLDRATVEFPRTGLVLISGRNGAGKSSLIEAVSVANWGSTLRGSPYWRQDSECQVEVHCDDLLVRRKVSPKGTKSFEWSVAGEDKSWTTVSKAQSEYDTRIVSFDTWQRCSVFSSADAALFTTASPSERQRLIESLLGIDRFDRALKLCRVELSEANALVLRFRADVDRHSAICREREKRLNEQLSVEPWPDDHYWWARRRVRNELAGLDSESRSIKFEIEALQLKIGELRRERVECEREIDRVKRGQCSACGRPYEQADLVKAKSESVARIEVIDRTIGLSECLLRDRRSRYDAISGEIKSAKHRFDSYTVEILHFQKSIAAHEEAVRRTSSVRVEYESAESELNSAKIGLEDAELRASELKIVESVLGTRGVRGSILVDALRGLEMLTNIKLERIFEGVRVGISPITERKGGGVADAISIKIEGIAGGLGYDANSNGERRKINIALLLALAELASASRPMLGDSTLWFDEAFDALDDDGVASVSDLIVDMSKDRLIVVISHNRYLIERLRAASDLSLSVEGGTLHELSRSRN